MGYSNSDEHEPKCDHCETISNGGIAAGDQMFYHCRVHEAFSVQLADDMRKIKARRAARAERRKRKRNEQLAAMDAHRRGADFHE